jgi:hypothetical protein
MLSALREIVIAIKSIESPRRRSELLVILAPLAKVYSSERWITQVGELKSISIFWSRKAARYSDSADSVERTGETAEFTAKFEKDGKKFVLSRMFASQLPATIWRSADDKWSNLFIGSDINRLELSDSANVREE